MAPAAAGDPDPRTARAAGVPVRGPSPHRAWPEGCCRGAGPSLAPPAPLHCFLLLRHCSVTCGAWDGDCGTARAPATPPGCPSAWPPTADTPHVPSDTHSSTHHPAYQPVSLLPAGAFDHGPALAMATQLCHPLSCESSEAWPWRLVPPVVLL